MYIVLHAPKGQALRTVFTQPVAGRGPHPTEVCTPAHLSFPPPGRSTSSRPPGRNPGSQAATCACSHSCYEKPISAPKRTRPWLIHLARRYKNPATLRQHIEPALRGVPHEQRPLHLSIARKFPSAFPAALVYNRSTPPTPAANSDSDSKPSRHQLSQANPNPGTLLTRNLQRRQHSCHTLPSARSLSRYYPCTLTYSLPCFSRRGSRPLFHGKYESMSPSEEHDGILSPTANQPSP